MQLIHHTLKPKAVAFETLAIGEVFVPTYRAESSNLFPYVKASASTAIVFYPTASCGVSTTIISPLSPVYPAKITAINWAWKSET